MKSLVEHVRPARALAAALILSTPPVCGAEMDMHKQHMMQMHHDMQDRNVQDQAGAAPALPGQDAFGAIQEIVHNLEADPATDWSKVDLEELRQHLIDMNEVTLNAEAAVKPIDGGLEIAVTGSGRTLTAIQHMLPAHAQAINGLHGWHVESEPLPNGFLLTVTSMEAKEIAHIRGLGFIGLLVSGPHHPAHHLAMAKGEFARGQ
jgi:hypothetical protein